MAVKTIIKIFGPQPGGPGKPVYREVDSDAAKHLIKEGLAKADDRIAPILKQIENLKVQYTNIGKNKKLTRDEIRKKRAEIITKANSLKDKIVTTKRNTSKLSLERARQLYKDRTTKKPPVSSKKPSNGTPAPGAKARTAKIIASKELTEKLAKADKQGQIKIYNNEIKRLNRQLEILRRQHKVATGKEKPRPGEKPFRAEGTKRRDRTLETSALNPNIRATTRKDIINDIVARGKTLKSKLEHLQKTGIQSEAPIKKTKGPLADTKAMETTEKGAKQVEPELGLSRTVVSPGVGTKVRAMGKDERRKVSEIVTQAMKQFNFKGPKVREQLNKDIKAFLDKGGKITKVKSNIARGRSVPGESSLKELQQLSGADAPIGSAGVGKVGQGRGKITMDPEGPSRWKTSPIERPDVKRKSPRLSDEPTDKDLYGFKKGGRLSKVKTKKAVKTRKVAKTRKVVRGTGAAKRGFGKATYSRKMY